MPIPYVFQAKKFKKYIFKKSKTHQIKFQLLNGRFIDLLP